MAFPVYTCLLMLEQHPAQYFPRYYRDIRFYHLNNLSWSSRDKAHKNAASQQLQIGGYGKSLHIAQGSPARGCKSSPVVGINENGISQRYGMGTGRQVREIRKKVSSRRPASMKRDVAQT